jgi:DUF971 family protein
MLGLNQTDLSLMPVKLGGKWTYMNPDGKYVFDRMFEDAYWYSESLALVKSGGKWGYINSKGEYVIKPKFETAGSFQEGLAQVKSGGKWGYINSKGEYAIAPQFKEAGTFCDGLARVKSTDGKVGYIGKNGKYVIAANYRDGSVFFGEQAFTLSASGAVVCIDKTGNTKFTLEQAQYVWGYSEGLTMFLTPGGKIKYINKLGKVVFEKNCDFVGKCAVHQCGGNLSLGQEIEIVNEPQTEYSEGLAKKQSGNKWGFIDKTGNFVIKPQFDDAHDFSEGLAAVKLNGKWGYIDKNGSFGIQLQFDDIRVERGFYGGVASVWDSDEESDLYINKRGEVIYTGYGTEPTIHYLPNGVTFVLSDGGGYALVSAIGTIAKVDDIKDLPSSKNGFDFFFGVANGKLEDTYISGLECQ